MRVKRIYMSGDHAGFKLKVKIKKYLENKGYEIVDFGPMKFIKGDDYPDYVIPMARALVKEKGVKDIHTKNARGIIVAGSGMGEAISSNKIKGIRAALYHGGSPRIVKTSREHDDTNVLCLGSRFVTEKEAIKAINIFLNEDFDKGRHSRRLKKYSNFC